MDITGTTLSRDGYLLTDVSAPSAAGIPGTLSFTIRAADGTPVTGFAPSHGKALHLIVVRTDGVGYRHLHPALDAATGIWSTPVAWDAAGSYRIFADATPLGADGITLSHTIDVAGDLRPVSARGERRHVSVDDLDVHLEGALLTGDGGVLTVTVSEHGHPVQRLEPYLSAFGHLVALREGDLAYLHVHALGDDPAPGSLSGPEIAFHASAPTPGRYFLYLDFQVDGRVRTASFVVEASDAPSAPVEHHSHHVHAH
ncbi:hypothetical protein DY023_08325 [Microbacterium bovistercoris]|uniref:Secreted protein n=1 Tax=Microbacterium bovistercoris TaxID=2293570 RepID=A0A371NU74_9MICO|nr:hypothetical protein [Microbacterium bovistercoris]REJ05933.1 hypothetical protein DY023_08325 [Microbacterium bovistercoris]